MADDKAPHGRHAAHPDDKKPGESTAHQGHKPQAESSPSRRTAGHEAGDQAHAGHGADAEGRSVGPSHSMGAASIPLAFRPTRAQVASVNLASVLSLAAALIFSAQHANLSLGARDVGGAIMPPGMIMPYDTPGEAMLDMSAVDPRAVSYTASPDARGDVPLKPRLEDGVKVFDLTASVIRWNILPDEQVMAYAFNQQVPGPRLQLVEGDRVRIRVTNQLPEDTSVHWHGLILPNAMDGAAYVTQDPIRPGETYMYEFTVQQHGTFFYHSHNEPDRQQALGLYGALIIEPRLASEAPDIDVDYTILLQEWLEREGYTYPAMPMEGGMPNYFTINGKSYPSTDVIEMQLGQRILLRFIGSSNGFIHPMHVHGGPFRVVAIDGNDVAESAQTDLDTVNVGPGQRYDVAWTAREPGDWLIHCHIPHHAENNNVEVEGGGGLMMIIRVAP